MILLLKRSLYFYILFVPFIISGAFILSFTSKPDFFILLNSYNNPVADEFFFYTTWLGNGLFFLIICLIILFKNIGNGILGLSVFALSSLLPQFFKKLVFSEAIRPMKYFEGNNHLHLVEGVNNHMYHSFPSGHSTTVFALAFFLTLIVKDDGKASRWGIVFAALAIVIAYSRIYLAQHFFEDIYAGACLGVISTMLIFLLMEKWIKGKKGINRGLLKSS